MTNKATFPYFCQFTREYITQYALYDMCLGSLPGVLVAVHLLAAVFCDLWQNKEYH